MTMKKTNDDLAMKRIKRAEKACREAQDDRFKAFWYNTLKNYVRSMVRCHTLIRL